ncbi:MAG: rod shape-determining protein MreD [Chromatiaceae bacterium]
MTDAPSNRTYVIVLSLAVAVVLTILPVPDWAEELRPQWVALTLVYWCLALPDRVGVFWAWSTGLVLDVAAGTLLGQHALSLSVVAYLVVELHPRIRIFPLWQQALSVWVLLLVERLLSLWVIGATGQPTPTLWYWAPTFVGMLLWPWIFIVLRDVRRRFRVS